MTSTSIYRGDTWRRAWKFPSTFEDILSARLQVRDPEFDELFISVSTSTGELVSSIDTDLSKRIDMICPASLTKIPPGKYNFDIEVTFVSGIIQTYDSSVLIVLKDQTV